MSGAVLGGGGAAGFRFWSGGRLRVSAVGGELGVGDGSFRDGDRLGGSGRRRYRLRSGETGFAGEFPSFVRGGTALFAVHDGDRPFGKLEEPVGGFSSPK